MAFWGKKNPTRKNPGEKKGEKKSGRHAGLKNADAKKGAEKEEKKNAKMMAGKYDKRMKELQQDGIIILFDQPNLEISNKERMEKKVKKKLKCTIDYDEIASIIARGGSGSKDSKRRKILKQIVVTSENLRSATGARMDKRWREEKSNEYLVSPVSSKGRDKAVRSMIVRRIVEEYASLEMVRLLGKKVPRRTFCIVSADSEFVDVAREAVARGFDVELWMFRDHDSFSKKLWVRAHDCVSRRCGRFSEKDLGKHEGKVTKCRRPTAGGIVSKSEKKPKSEKVAKDTKKKPKDGKVAKNTTKEKRAGDLRKAAKKPSGFQPLDTGQEW